MAPLELAVVRTRSLPDIVARTPVPPVVVLGVTRRKNAALVRRLYEQTQDVGGRCLLWALDEPVDGLAHVTAGQGPGSRTELLNRLAAQAAVTPDEYVVLADDDVELVVGDLATLLKVCVVAGFSIAQPAHSFASYAAFRFIEGHAALVARATNVVECGPYLAVSPGFRDRVLPIPDDFGMGWGLELVWHLALRDGERFGIVDAVRQRHHGLIAKDYPHSAKIEQDRFVALRDAHGLANLPVLQRTLGTWRRREAAPPW